jgi:hypothetical protein
VSPSSAPKTPITERALIVGEGKSDAAFLKHLCALHGVTGILVEESGGTGKFPQYFDALKQRTYFDRLQAMLVVGDNDDRPDDSFKALCRCLKKQDLPSPNQRLVVARIGNQGLAVVVMMVPYTIAGGPTKGCLESLLLQALTRDPSVVQRCLDDYKSCMGFNGTKNQETKFRLRCSLAALVPDNPNTSLEFALDPAKNLFSLNHSCFDEIATFLRKFKSLCGVT